MDDGIGECRSWGFGEPTPLCNRRLRCLRASCTRAEVGAAYAFGGLGVRLFVLERRAAFKSPR